MPHPALPGYLYTLESPVEGSSSFLRTCHDLLFKVDESTMFRKVVTPGWRTLLVLYLIVGILVVKFVQGGVGNGLVYMGAFGIALVCIGSFVGVLGR